MRNWSAKLEEKSSNNDTHAVWQGLPGEHTVSSCPQPPPDKQLDEKQPIEIIGKDSYEQALKDTSLMKLITEFVSDVALKSTR